MKIDKWAGSDRQAYTINGKTFNIARIIELSRNLPRFRIPLDHLYINYSMGDLGVRDFVAHAKSVEAADLSYPIILNEDGVILDGRHRLIKALLLGEDDILAVRFEKDPEPDREVE